MVIHDFIYEWDGKTHTGKKPISWWPGSYHVKIVKLSTDDNNVSYLVPYAVILKNARIHPTMNTSLKNYIHTFAQKISEKYDLDMEKTLWVEIEDTIRVTRISEDTKVVESFQYAVPWRAIRPNELEMIKPYLADM